MTKRKEIPMTADQINFIFNKYGGKEKVIKEKMFEVYFDNPRNYLPDANATPEERMESIQFDDKHELCIILENGRIWNTYYDYRPTVTRVFIPYDNIQGIHVLEGVLGNLNMDMPTKTQLNQYEKPDSISGKRN